MENATFLTIIFCSVLFIAVILTLISYLKNLHTARIVYTPCDKLTLHTPQIKVKGVWFNVVTVYNDGKHFVLRAEICDEFLSPNDALNSIIAIRKQGVKIESNKLTKEQSYSYVD